MSLYRPRGHGCHNGSICKWKYGLIFVSTSWFFLYVRSSLSSLISSWVWELGGVESRSLFRKSVALSWLLFSCSVSTVQILIAFLRRSREDKNSFGSVLLHTFFFFPRWHLCIVIHRDNDNPKFPWLRRQNFLRLTMSTFWACNKEWKKKGGVDCNILTKLLHRLST